MIYTLSNKKYTKPEYLIKQDRLVSTAIQGLEFELSEVWK